MTAMTALRALTDIDPAWIVDADAPRPARIFRPRGLIAVAACLALICAAGAGFALCEQPEPPTVVDLPRLDTLNACYAFPKDGDVGMYIEVSTALNQYRGQHVLFWVSLDIGFNDAKQMLNEDQAAIVAECERLSALGYEVYTRHNNWTGYWGEPRHYTTVCLKISPDELTAFETVGALPCYGYMFRPAPCPPEDCVPFAKPRLK